MKQIAPHGGSLINRWLRGAERAEAIERAARLARIRLDSREAADLEMIGDGALSPLTGFMTREDYESVLREMRLAGGLLWALPVTLAVSREQAAPLSAGQEIALESPDGKLMALMRIAEKFSYDKELEALQCYRTADLAHPGVRRLMEQGEVYLGGEVWLVDRVKPAFPAYHLTPAETRAAFAEKGWQRVVGFQTRNPVHRAHEYIQKCALEICDGLLLHPLVGETKPDDIPAEIRMRAYTAILEGYFPADRTLLSVFPAAMRYAGPREAVWHALCRKNYGWAQLATCRSCRSLVLHAIDGSMNCVERASHSLRYPAPVKPVPCARQEPELPVRIDVPLIVQPMVFPSKVHGSGHQAWPKTIRVAGQLHYGLAARNGDCDAERF
ncbi:MAG: sulfate adenylyltransferase [Bacillota bacterium]